MIDKNSWGEYMWHTIHFVSLGYPNNPSDIDKTNYKNFYENLQNVLPCDECAKHLEQNLKKLPVTNYLSSREKLFEWTVLIHNKVNKKLGRREWNVKEAHKYYTDPLFNLKNSAKCFNNSYLFISVLLFIIILIILFNNTKISKKILKFKK